MDDKYNGWTNRATWNVNLWVMNDYGAYLQWRSASQMQGGAWTEEEAECFASCIFGDVTPDGDRLGDVDWFDLAESWSMDAAEHGAYA